MSLPLPSNWKNELKTAQNLKKLVEVCLKAEQSNKTFKDPKQATVVAQRIMTNLDLMYQRVQREWGPIHSTPQYSLREYQLSVREGLKVRDRLPRDLSEGEIEKVQSALDQLGIDLFDTTNFCRQVTQLPWLMASEAEKLSSSCRRIEMLMKRLFMEPQEFQSVFGTSKLNEKGHNRLARLSYDLFQLGIRNANGLKHYLQDYDSINLSSHPRMRQVLQVIRVLSLYHSLSSFQDNRRDWDRFSSSTCRETAISLLQGKELVQRVEHSSWEQLAPIFPRLPYWCPSFDFDTLLCRAVQLNETYRTVVKQGASCSRNTLKVVEQLIQQGYLEDRANNPLIPRVIYYLEKAPIKSYTAKDFTLPSGFDYSRPWYPVLCDKLGLHDSSAVMGAFIQLCTREGHLLNLSAKKFKKAVEKGMVYSFPPPEWDEIPLDDRSPPTRPGPDAAHQVPRNVPSEPALETAWRGFLATLIEEILR